MMQRTMLYTATLIVVSDFHSVNSARCFPVPFVPIAGKLAIQNRDGFQQLSSHENHEGVRRYFCGVL
jgi:hypothetical protein